MWTNDQDKNMKVIETMKVSRIGDRKIVYP